MHTRISPIIALGCLAFLQPVAADLIALKSGEKIEGSIIREDGDDYVVEVLVSGTIRDERRIARADVKFIEKKPADEKAFEEIGVPVPTPDLLDREAYEEWMAKLEEFLKAYPKSPKAETAKELLDILGSEHAIVAAGGIKFGGEMVSADDYEANAYKYDAKIAEMKIKDAVARRDFLSALRRFSDYGERFGESEGSQGMCALMLQVLGAYRSTLDESLATLERRIEKRKSGLASMTPEDRVKTERALTEEMETIDKRYQKEKTAGKKWVTPESFHKESMDEALRAVDSEITRLRKLPEPQPLEMPLAEVYRVAWGKLADVAGEEVEPADDTVEEESDPANATEEEKRLAENAKEERKRALEVKKSLQEEGTRKVIEEAKAGRLPEYYLAKLRIRAGLDEN